MRLREKFCASKQAVDSQMKKVFEYPSPCTEGRIVPVRFETYNATVLRRMRRSAMIAEVEVEVSGVREAQNQRKMER